MSRQARCALFVVLLAAPGLVACAKAKETFSLASDGSGTYTLSVRFDADLLHRLEKMAGPGSAWRIEGRPFPLDAEAWRDGLSALEGVSIESLTSKTEAGFREISLVAHFAHLQDILRWEVLARRHLRVGLIDEATGEAVKGERAEEGKVGVWAMDPFAFVPFLDPLATALAAVQAPDPRPPGDAEPGSLERLGVSREDARLIATILAPRLEEISLSTTVRISGTVVSVDGKPVGASDQAGLTLDFASLRSNGPRGLSFRWDPALLDVVPSVEQGGDAPPPSVPGEH